MAGKQKYDFTGEVHDDWSIIEYIGKSQYKCKCLLCGKERNIGGYFINKGQIPKCICKTGKVNSKGLIDLTGKTFGDWVVESYAGDKKWNCVCTCGKHRTVSGSDLRNGKSTGCGHNSNRKINDLTCKQFGDWLVIEKGQTGSNGETMWLCECQCELHTRKLVSAYALKSGTSKSCGHNTTGYIDLTGKTFGNWKVICRDTDEKPKDTRWICQCKCGNVASISSYALRNGLSKSCGCLKEQIREQTTLERYGVSHASQIGTDRTTEQLDAIKSKDKLKGFIVSQFKDWYKPTTEELGSKLGLDRASTMIHIHKYELEDYISTNGINTSTQERFLRQIFPTDFVNDRSILDGKEIDLYYPEKHFGLEFNGNYWHGELKKDKNYHQNKSLLAYKKNVHLFHIFEYEMNDNNTRRKIIKIVKNNLGLNTELRRVYARKCIMKAVSDEESKLFLENNHLQGYAKADVNIGLYYDNKIVGIMTFGKPRFDNSSQWELIRLAYDLDYSIVAGTKRMFTAFIRKYNPDNIVSYCDLSKFTGKTYESLGFKRECVTQPNYKWVEMYGNRVLTRYQTQKRKLIEQGLGDESQTEADIMHNLGFCRVYDSGNLKMVWTKE